MRPEPTYEARSPRSEVPETTRVPLTSRPVTWSGARVVVIRTMPPGSGLEAVAEAVIDRFRLDHPDANVEDYQRRQFLADDPVERAEIAARADLAVVVSGPGATSVHLSMTYAAALERVGVPTVATVFASLERTAEHVCDLLAAPVRWVSTPVHVDGSDALDQVARRVIDAAERPLIPDEQLEGVRPARVVPRIAVRGTLREIDDHFLREGWGDGLPLVPPTAEAVEEMLAGTSRSPDEVVTASFRPEGLPATVEQVAINAVMAGARAVHLPAILATASMMGHQAFESQTRSVNSFAWAQLISGPYAQDAGMRGGLNALGPGARANAVIGRALHLMIRNLGHAEDGVTTSVTQGNPAGWAFAFTENSAQSPWEPFHVSEGFAPGESTSSLFTMGFAHDGTFYYGDLDAVARSLAALADLPAGALVLITAKRAQQLADAGMSKRDVESYLHERAVVRLGDLRSSGFWPAARSRIELGLPLALPSEYLHLSDDDLVPLYPQGSIKVAVVGADVASLIQVWILALHGTVRIDDWV